MLIGPSLDIIHDLGKVLRLNDEIVIAYLSTILAVIVRTDTLTCIRTAPALLSTDAVVGLTIVFLALTESSLWVLLLDLAIPFSQLLALQCQVIVTGIIGGQMDALIRTLKAIF